MTLIAWLAGRELRVRRGRMAIVAGVVATLAAAATATEMIERAREEAMAVQADAMGPSLTIVRAGVTPGSLARHEIAGRFLPSDIESRVERALGSDLRRTERRLTITRDLGGSRVIVIGTDDPTLPTPVRAGSALVGAELTRSIGSPPSVVLGNAVVPVAGTRPSTGGAEDIGLTVSLETARSLEGLPGAMTELRLYLRSGAAANDAEQRLLASRIAASIVRHDRGDVVETGIPEALGRHRLLAYALIAAIAAVTLLIASHLDTAEREGEIATLLAIGAPRSLLLAVLTTRSVIAALIGASAGAASGILLAAIQDPANAPALVRHWATPAATIAVAVILAALATIPAALRASLRDPAQPIQDC